MEILRPSSAPSRLRAFAFNSVLATLTAILCVIALAFTFTACAKRQTPVEHGNAHQILHRGIGPEIADLDPNLATSTDDYTVLTALFEGLVSEDPVTLAPVPGTAARWDISPDGLTYTFHLRPEAKWSDGSAVTAHDFVASFRRTLTPALASQAATKLHLIRGARAFNTGETTDPATLGLATPDDHTLVVTLERPTPSFLAQLNQTAFLPVPRALLEKQNALAARNIAWTKPGTLISNGPFRLTAWKTNQVISTEKNPHYWDAATVRLNAVNFYPFDSRDAEERAFRAGQLHLTEALPPARLSAYRNEKSPFLRIDPYLGTEFYRLRVTDPALQDVNFRRALSAAIDREALCEKILGGAQSPANGFIPPALLRAVYPNSSNPKNILYHSPSFSLQDARQLLAEAGYPGGKNAPPLELLYNTSETHRTVAEAIQQMWRKELGLEVRLVNQENKIVQQARRAGTYQIARSSWIADYASPENFLEIFQANHPQNLTGWSSDYFEKLLKEAASETDPAKRFFNLWSADKFLLSQAPIIPLYHNTHIFLLQPSVKNWHPTLLDHHPLKHVYLAP